MVDLCSDCRNPFPADVLAQAHSYAFWTRADGACPACVQQNLLRTLLAQGDAALHAAVQTAWPLDAEAAFGALPTRLRLHADPRFTGRGVTIALVDAGFYPHPDLVQPHNRIRAWADASTEPIRTFRFAGDDQPQWPEWNAAHDWQWHGQMTSVVAAGNGFLSHGLYSGLAHASELVLVQVRDTAGHITSASIARALRWLRIHAPEFGIRVVSLSVSGDPVERLQNNPVDEAVAALIDDNISVVAAAGNDGQRRLLPPATAPLALTVGGIDDKNVFHHDELALWHSNYGNASNDVPKPELVAPSIWVVAPILPETKTATQAIKLFAERPPRDSEWQRRAAELKLITPHYQHVEGTSFAAPIVSSAIACLLEANPKLTPLLVRELLTATAQPVRGADRQRQGAGAIEPGRAIARALAEMHGSAAAWRVQPQVSAGGVTFALHDHASAQVKVLGSWDNWKSTGIVASQLETGFWKTAPRTLPPGSYAYKFLLDGQHWLDDPANPAKAPDGHGALNSIFEVP